ncbi:MAG TPA: DUF4349 domain-containing protein [Cyclobacteriaceae bacterium]|nr:DUF4349 domain-containing protein [Cyclobacteriaceae bacterium]
MRGILIIGLCCVLGSCQNGGDLRMQSMKMGRAGYADVENPQATFASNDEGQSAPVAVERKLIKNGSMEFEVSDIGETKKSILQLTAEFGGYVSSDNQNNYSGTPRYEQTVRVPAEKLDEFIAKVEALARNVDSKNISVQDVTEQFIDVETRLKTKKELEARYLELLKQSKTVKDLIEVETQLANVRGEIESMEGRLKYLTNQVAFSTVTLTYYQPVSGNTGFGYRFSRTFGAGWDNFLGFVIGVFEAWPFILVTGVLIWLFIRWRRKRRQNV